MKVVYKQPMHEKIFSAYEEAVFANRDIERIELNDDEWYRFLSEIEDSRAYIDAYINDNAYAYGFLVVHVR